MYVRVINSQFVSGKEDEGLSVWRDNVAPGLKHTKGFKGAYVGGDRSTGKSVVITLWETEDDANAMNVGLSQTLALFDGLLAAQPETNQYEVLLQV
jgi:hypothetical protein